MNLNTHNQIMKLKLYFVNIYIYYRNKKKKAVGKVYKFASFFKGEIHHFICNLLLLLLVVDFLKRQLRDHRERRILNDDNYFRIRP